MRSDGYGTVASRLGRLGAESRSIGRQAGGGRDPRRWIGKRGAAYVGRRLKPIKLGVIHLLDQSRSFPPSLPLPLSHQNWAFILFSP